MKHTFYLQDEPGAKSVFSDVLQSRERSSHLVKKRSIVLDEMAFRMITCKILFWVIFHVKSVIEYVSGKKSVVFHVVNVGSYVSASGAGNISCKEYREIHVR